MLLIHVMHGGTTSTLPGSPTTTDDNRSAPTRPAYSCTYMCRYARRHSATYGDYSGHILYPHRGQWDKKSRGLKLYQRGKSGPPHTTST